KGYSARARNIKGPHPLHLGTPHSIVPGPRAEQHPWSRNHISVGQQSRSRIRMSRLHGLEKIHILESTASVCHRGRRTNQRCTMNPLEGAENSSAAGTNKA